MGYSGGFCNVFFPVWEDLLISWRKLNLDAASQNILSSASIITVAWIKSENNSLVPYSAWLVCGCRTGVLYLFGVNSKTETLVLEDTQIIPNSEFPIVMDSIPNSNVILCALSDGSVFQYKACVNYDLDETSNKIANLEYISRIPNTDPRSVTFLKCFNESTIVYCKPGSVFIVNQNKAMESQRVNLQTASQITSMCFYQL